MDAAVTQEYGYFAQTGFPAAEAAGHCRAH
jgi:hypothetical protein